MQVGTDITLEQAVQRLLDIEEIKNLKARYFRCVDLHYWDEFRELFTEDLQIDFAESTSRPLTRDQFVASVQRHFVEGTVSVHHGHLAEIEILDATTAKAFWPMFDLVEPPAGSSYQTHTGYGHYTEEYRKVDGRWRIAKTKLSRIKRVVLESAHAGN